MECEEDLLDDNSCKEYGDLEDLDADAEERLLGIGSDDEMKDNENYETQHEYTGEEVEYVDEEGNPVDIGEGDHIEYVDYTDPGHETDAYETGDPSADDVLDLVIDADLNFDDSVVQEDVNREPQQKKPRLSVSTSVGNRESSIQKDKEGVEHLEQKSQNVAPSDNVVEKHAEENETNSVSESETGDDDEEDEDEEETSGRGRFHSERPNIIHLSAAKKRTNIPDTLDGILQSNDSYRADSFADRRNKTSWEQQQRNRDYRGQGVDRDRGLRSNNSNSNNSHMSSSFSSAKSSHHSNQSKEAKSTALDLASRSSLLNKPPNLLARVAPQRDLKEPQAPRKILINPHFKRVANTSSSSTAANDLSVSGSSWVEDRPPIAHGAPLLDTPYQPKSIANYPVQQIHHEPSINVPSLMPGLRQQSQHLSLHTFNQVQPPPLQRHTLPPMHYSGHPATNYQQENSQILASTYQTSNMLPNNQGPATIQQFSQPLQQQHPQQQINDLNDMWHQNVPQLPTHDVQQARAWNNPQPSILPQFSVASQPNLTPQHWPPSSFTTPTPQSSYRAPMEQLHQQMQHMPTVSFPNVRLPPPNFNVPQNSASWQSHGLRPGPRFNHPPPQQQQQLQHHQQSLLGNVPANSQFLIPASSPLKPNTLRMPFNNTNNLRNGPSEMLNFRPRLPNAGPTMQQPPRLWPPALRSPGFEQQNLQAQFNRKRHLNQNAGAPGKIMKVQSIHQQMMNRRQFQTNSNIKEIQLVPTLPLTTSVSTKVDTTKVTPKIEIKSAVVTELLAEDEETRRYREQIELQKKKREEIMRIKEQRRQLMAIERRKQLAEQSKITSNDGNVDNTQSNVTCANQAANQELLPQPPPPLSVRTVGQPIMPLVSRVKKQVIVRKVTPLIAVNSCSSATFSPQSPGLLQTRFQTMGRQQKQPNQKGILQKPVASRAVILQKAISDNKQNIVQVPNFSTETKPKTVATIAAVNSKHKPIVVNHANPRQVIRGNYVVTNFGDASTNTIQTKSDSVNIVSKKFPVQAVNTRTVLTQDVVQQPKTLQQQLQFKITSATNQTIQQRTVIAGQQTKRTVLLNTADVKLVQQNQQSHPGVVVSGLQRRVLATRAVSACVQIDNLALSTSEAQVQKLCQNVGPVENIVLHRDKRTAFVTFRNQQHAHDFMSKYQKRMLDLSVMNISMVT